jgi:hypothetical protein
MFFRKTEAQFLSFRTEDANKIESSDKIRFVARDFCDLKGVGERWQARNRAIDLPDK